MQQKQPTKPSQGPSPDRNNSFRAFAKYGGMAFQLLAFCFAGLVAGRWIDAKIGVAKPTWTIFLTVLFMVAALYQLYRQLLNDK